MDTDSIRPLYDQSDMRQIAGQIRKTLVVFGIFAAVAIAGIVVSLVERVQWATIAITLVWGGLTLFFWSMKLTPPLAYRRFLKDIQTGLSRVAEGMLVELSPDLTFREGLYFHTMVINVGDQNDPEDDRLFYWNHQKPLPTIAHGDRIQVRSHGNDIIGLSMVRKADA